MVRQNAHKRGNGWFFCPKQVRISDASRPQCRLVTPRAAPSARLIAYWVRRKAWKPSNTVSHASCVPLEGNGGAKRRSCRPDRGVPAPFPRFRFENNWNKWNMFIKPQRNGQKVCSNSDFANWNNWNKPMPHPFCTSARIQPPPAGRPPLHRADARCT